MRILKKIIKVLLVSILILLIALGAFSLYVYSIADANPPKLTKVQEEEKIPTPIQQDSVSYAIGDNWITQNQYGLYEMYVSGAPYERGVKAGELSKTLVQFQEHAFTDQIKKMIPSEKYLKFLKYVIGFINRDLSAHVTKEYQEEIYGISQSASDSFQWVGDNYSRILNYHAAHDVGHALQNLMLVGCTSFGAWGHQAEGGMVLGRNFDFWVGDEFAENKIVEFVAPDSGYNFAYVTWGGFIGVVSGMNEQGLTVTINAAPSEIPYGAATPVSLVAREILQYAKNIKEAIAIARSREMFVSESFMIGSAKDQKAILIEKTPSQMDIVEPKDELITSTNHYQGATLGHTQLNLKAMETSASVYRQNRLLELIRQKAPLNTQKAADILRDKNGLGNKDIGLGNEKAINQLIAHHSIIMMPDSLRMWVSASPFQLGAYVCYDLKKVFQEHSKPKNGTVSEASFLIEPDSFLRTPEFTKFEYFRTVKNSLLYDYDHQYIFDIDRFLASNSNYYDTYSILGDQYAQQGNKDLAKEMYNEALKKEIATQQERSVIQKKISKLK